MNAHSRNRARLLVLTLLYEVCPIVSKLQFEIFSAFFSILYNILSKHDQYPKHLNYLDKIDIYNGNTERLFSFSLVKRIHSFIRSLIL